MLSEVSQISAELPHRDESKGIWTALTGEGIVKDSIEQPGTGLWGPSLNPGILWQAACTPTVSDENAALSGLHLGQGNSITGSSNSSL